MPAVTGEENEVPLALPRRPLPLTTASATPIAITSGFTLPSVVLPMEEKSALRSVRSIAPTVNILSASAGIPMSFHASSPALPALLHTSSPLEAASEALRETRCVLPSSSV